MKIAEFILLGEVEKKLAVLHEGVLIGKRKSPPFMIFLFQIQSFYVEAFFNFDHRDLKEFRVFNRTVLLQPYLDSIPIDDLLN